MNFGFKTNKLLICLKVFNRLYIDIKLFRIFDTLFLIKTIEFEIYLEENDIIEL
jgi:hypothetical protein